MTAGLEFRPARISICSRRGSAPSSRACRWYAPPTPEFPPSSIRWDAWSHSLVSASKGCWIPPCRRRARQPSTRGSATCLPLFLSPSPYYLSFAAVSRFAEAAHFDDCCSRSAAARNLQQAQMPQLTEARGPSHFQGPVKSIGQFIVNFSASLCDLRAGLTVLAPEAN